MGRDASSQTASYTQALHGLRRPLAWVDLERFDANARGMVARAGGLPIRIASKSVRCTSLLRRALSMPGFQGVLCYSGWEAVHLAQSGLSDLVVAYPIADRAEAEAVAQLAPSAQIVLMVDRHEHLEVLAGLTLEIAFDLDLSTQVGPIYFGVRRSALQSPADVLELLEKLKKYPSLRLAGAMGYEAQIAGVSDQSLFMRLLKAYSRPRVARRRQAMVAAIRDSGHSIRFVNGGGTGSLRFTHGDPSVTELAAGSGFFQPTLFEGYGEFQGEAAAGFALTVTRKPSDRIATCFGGGYVASGSAGPKKLPSPWLPEGLTLLPHEGAGEVQTPVAGSSTRLLRVGDPVFFRHAKAGELCERFDELHLISGDQVVETVPTYRGEGMNFG